MQYQSIILIDGENLILRYQTMITAGRIPKADNIHIQDSFVWNKNAIVSHGARDVVRVSYYTTVVGDEDRIRSVKDDICKAPFVATTFSGHQMDGTLVPYVFKKHRNGSKTKSVDINLTIDALRYAYGNSIQQIVLVTGDGDYIPLLREVMSRGKMIQVWALSSGLNPEIVHTVDDFLLLDDVFFEPKNEA